MSAIIVRWVLAFAMFVGLADEAFAQSRPGRPGRSVVVKQRNRYLPVEVVGARNARPTTLITLEDVRRRIPNATLDTPVRLKSGKTISVRQAIPVLNALERRLNAAGLSLRDAQRPRVKVVSRVRVAPELWGTQQPSLPPNVPFTQFTPGVWRALAGEKDAIGVELVHRTDLKNNALGVVQSQTAELVGFVFGSSFGLATATQSGMLLPRLNGCSLTANAFLTEPEIPQGASCGATGSATTDAIKDESAKQDVEYTQPIWGPLEVTVKLGVTADARVYAKTTAGTHSVTGDEEFVADVWLSARVVGGVYLVEAGLQADVLMARYTLHQNATLQATEQPSVAEWQSTGVTWNSTSGSGFETGNGSLKFVLVFNVPVYGEVTVDWEITTFDGYTIPVQNVTWGPFAGTRPAVCLAASGAEGITCAGVCTNVLGDKNNCGDCASKCSSGGPNAVVSCRQGSCSTCYPRCTHVQPGGGNGCGGTCPSCASRSASTPYWCDCLEACTASAGSCDGMCGKVVNVRYDAD